MITFKFLTIVFAQASHCSVYIWVVWTVIPPMQSVFKGILFLKIVIKLWKEISHHHKIGRFRKWNQLIQN